MGHTSGAAHVVHLNFASIHVHGSLLIFIGNAISKISEKSSIQFDNWNIDKTDLRKFNWRLDNMSIDGAIEKIWQSYKKISKNN